MMKRTASSIKPIGEALDDLVEKLGIRGRLREYEAVIQWESIVGEQIAKVTTASRITKGVLFVKVKTGTWRNELTIRKREIIQKINSTLGGVVVTDIKFQ